MINLKSLKNVMLGIVLLAALGFVTFGGREYPAPPEGRVLVQYWEKWTGKEAEQMQEIVDWFNATVGEEKGIYVEYLSMSNISQKTLVSTAAGVPPDVAGLWDGQVAQFAALDALEPLDEMAAEHGIAEGYYKPTYWKSCQYRGKLYALISTPAATALHYNKQILLDNADELRAAGFDPEKPPGTLQEFDRFAQILDEYEETPGGSRRINVTGYLPMEPGWFLTHTGYWFGTSVYDEATDTVQILSPQMIEAGEWIRSYSQRLGQQSMSEFRGGFGQFNSTQNPFFTGDVAMVKQGPWMANYIELHKPAYNRWRVPPEKLKRETDYESIAMGMTLDDVEALLGEPMKSNDAGEYVWDGGVKTLHVRFADEKVAAKESRLLPAKQRQQYCQWGAVPFPSAVPGLEDVAYAGFDTLVIPKGAKHKKEAFEFIAFVNRQDVMEKLCSLHCKNSPLAQVSADFIDNHPNPYIDVFERLAASENARGIPPIGIWPQLGDELNVAIQRLSLLKATPKEALREAQERVEGKYDLFRTRQRKREGVR